MSAKKEIKLGVFGLGRGGAYLESFLACGFKIVAVCDKNESRIEEAKRFIGDGVVGYTDFDEFLKHDIDAVFLANYFTEHADYAIRCLEKDIHVLSECTSNVTMADGVRLVRAAEASRAFYMLAENCPYMLINLEMKRVYDSGTLGRCVFAEGEYNHPEDPADLESVTYHRPSVNHWRNYLARSYYLTHSLGPLMYFTGAVPKKVNAFAAYMPEVYQNDSLTGIFVGDAAALITTLNDDDSIFRVTGHSSFGGHEVSYRICGLNGQIENLRGQGEQILLRYNPWNLPEGAEKSKIYTPVRNDKDEDLIIKTGHGGSDFIVARTFFESIRDNKKPDFDVYFATTMASVAILAHRSILSGGATYDVPDFHNEADRRLWENDTLTPFPGSNGEPPSLPCCSHPDYKPADEVYNKYTEILKNKNT